MALNIRSALSRVDCGVLVIDGGRVGLVNPHLRELFGLPDDVGAAGNAAAEVVDALAGAMQDPDGFRARLDELAQAVEPVNEDLVTSDGRVLEREYLPVLDGGVATGYVCLYWDVSTVRNADLERVRRQRAEIIAQQMGVHAQRSRAAEAEHAGRSLAEQNRALAASNAQRKELLATASHELRTPLTSILGFSDLLTEGDVGEATIRQYAAIINRNARSLLDVVDDLLLLASLGAAEARPTADAVGVDKLLTQVAESLGPLADAAGVAIVVQCDPALVVPGDRNALERVVSNVVSNAVKYSHRGATVSAVATADGDEARIEVSDAGIGIPEDEVGLVFGQFFRASTARSSGREGTGLGLAVARSIVAQHGGTITLTSTVGEGTTVTLRLPTRAR